MFECLPRNLSNGSRQFNACGTCPYDREREPCAPLSGVGYPFCDLKCVENLMPKDGRFFDTLQSRSPFLPFVVSVVRGLRTGGHD